MITYSTKKKLLNFLDIFGKYIRIFQNICWQQNAYILIEIQFSIYRTIERAITQGCVFKPDIFNLYSELNSKKIRSLIRIYYGRPQY